MVKKEFAEDFNRELQALINRHSIDTRFNTPDFILASYLQNCLVNYGQALSARSNWMGENYGGK